MSRNFNSTTKLPDGWRWMRLGEVIAEAQPGFACGERDPNGLIQLRMNNVDTRGNFVWNEFLRVPFDKNQIEKYELIEGDVLFNNTNSVELVGKSALFLGHTEPVVYSNHFTRIRVDQSKIFAAYLAAWLIHQWKSKTFERICNRWIGQSAVKSGKLLSLSIPLPPLPEQKRIAAILNEQMVAVEKARAAAEAQYETAKALPAAYLKDVFKYRTGDKLPEGWRWVRVGEICKFKRGPFGGSLRKEIFVKDGYKVYEQQHAIRNNFEIGHYFISEEKYGEMLDFSIKPNDLILSCSGTMGKVAIVPDNVKPGIINQALLKLTPNTGIVLPNFIKYILKSDNIQHRYFKDTAGAAIQNVASVSQLKTIPIPLPSLFEQKSIVENLNQQMIVGENLRKSIEDQLYNIKSLPAALLCQAFSGVL